MKMPPLLLFSVVLAATPLMNRSSFASPKAASSADVAAALSAAELDAKEERLWADRPDFTALFRENADGDRPPRLLTVVQPEHPRHLRRAGVKGSVLISLIVAEDGRVEAARVLHSPDERLNKATVAAIMKWKFLPAARKDHPAKAGIRVPVEFR